MFSRLFLVPPFAFFLAASVSNKSAVCFSVLLAGFINFSCVLCIVVCRNCVEI